MECWVDEVGGVYGISKGMEELVLKGQPYGSSFSFSLWPFSRSSIRLSIPPRHDQRLFTRQFYRYSYPTESPLRETFSRLLLEISLHF